MNRKTFITEKKKDHGGDMRVDVRSATPARIVVALVGINLWFILLFLTSPPGFSRWAFWPLVFYAVPMTALIIGLILKSGIWLIGVYPILLGLAVISRDMFGDATPLSNVSYIGLILSGMSLVGYLLISSAALEWETRPAEDPPELKRLATPTVPGVWRRRKRIYLYLLAATIVFPVSLIIAFNVSPRLSSELAASYEDRAAAMKVFINTALCSVWILVFFLAFRGPLILHSKGDRPLLRKIAEHKHDRMQEIWAMVFLGTLALLLLTFYWIGYS